MGIGLNPAGVIAFVLFDIALILILARVMGALAKKVGQPSVVGEIIAGVLLGPTLFGATLAMLPASLMEPGGALGFLNCQASLQNWTVAITPPPADGSAVMPPPFSVTRCLFPPQATGILNLLGNLALLFFMFLVGLELDFKKLKGFGKSITLVTIGVVAIPVAVGFLISPVMFQDVFKGPAGDNALAFNLFMGAALSVTALPVMARILQEKGLSQTQMGSIGVAAAAAVTVLMFLLVAIAGTIARAANASPPVSPTPQVLRLVILTLVFTLVMFFVIRPLLDRMISSKYQARVTARGGPDDPQGWSEVDAFAPSGIGWALTHGMFAWIIIFVTVSGLIAHLLGINVIVGGFLAGAVLPAREGLARDMLAELFDFTVIFLLPIFLAFSGLNTDFTQLSAAAVPGIIVFILAAVISKVASGAVFGKLGGLTWKEGNALGILMNCRGLLPLVVGIIGLQTMVISPAGQVTIVLMALVTTIMTGPLFDKFDPARSTAAEPPPAKKATAKA